MPNNIEILSPTSRLRWISLEARDEIAKKEGKQVDETICTAKRFKSGVETDYVLQQYWQDTKNGGGEWRDVEIDYTV